MFRSSFSVTLAVRWLAVLHLHSGVRVGRVLFKTSVLMKSFGEGAVGVFVCLIGLDCLQSLIVLFDRGACKNELVTDTAIRPFGLSQRAFILSTFAES
jgi:hypothetical protein